MIHFLCICSLQLRSISYTCSTSICVCRQNWHEPLWHIMTYDGEMWPCTLVILDLLYVASSGVHHVSWVFLFTVNVHHLKSLESLLKWGLHVCQCQIIKSLTVLYAVNAISICGLGLYDIYLNSFSSNYTLYICIAVDLYVFLE